MDPLATFGPYTLLRAISATRDSVSFAASFEGSPDGPLIAAVKVLRPHLLAAEGLEEALVEEMKLASRLNHVNVGQVFDFAKHDDHAYIVLEFVDGVPVSAIQAAVEPGQKAVSPEVAAYVCAETCAGIAYAHGRRDERGNVLGIAHARLNPRVILLSKSGFVKIVDFGLSRALTDVAAIEPDPYELQFVAPEVVRGDDYDGRADVFSVGAIAFFLLTGRPIYGDAEGPDLVAKARRGYVPSIRDVDDEIPEALAELVDKALSSAPDDRYADAAELRSGLAAWLRRNSPGFGRHRLKAYMQRLLPETTYGLLEGQSWEPLHRKHFRHLDTDSLIAERVEFSDGIAPAKDAIAPLMEDPEVPSLRPLDIASMKTGAHPSIQDAAAAARERGRTKPAPATNVTVPPLPSAATPPPAPDEEPDEAGEGGAIDQDAATPASDSAPPVRTERSSDDDALSGDSATDADDAAAPSTGAPRVPKLDVPSADAGVQIDPSLVYDNEQDHVYERSVITEAATAARTSSRAGTVIGVLVALALLGGLAYGAWWLVQQQEAATATTAPERVVFVTSRPQGARIVVDGQDSGLRTPAPLRGLGEGSTTIAVDLEGFEAPPSKTIEPDAPNTEVAFELQPREHRIVVESEPEGADIVVDGEVVGTTPGGIGPLRVDYRTGVDIILRKEGFLSGRVTATWDPSERESAVRLTLDPDPDAAPEGADAPR